MAKDIYRYYRQEAHELVERIARGLQLLAKGGSSSEEMTALNRAAHTLKGASQLVRRADIAERAHAIESALDITAKGEGLFADEVERLLKLNDEIITLLSQLQPAETATQGTSAKQAEGSIPADNVLHTIRVDLKQMDALLQHANEAYVSLSELRARLADLERISTLSSTLASITAGPASRSSGHNRALPMNIAQEINTLVQQARRGLQESHERAEREVVQLRSSTETLRLVPAERIFSLLEHAVRDSARNEKKEIQFSAHGGDIQLDAHVLAMVKDALVQLVRNSVAHGIEAPAGRQQLGKAREGTISLSVRRERNRIIFEMKDDGGGIDAEALRARAAQRGWIDASTLAKATPEQVLHLIFRPGVTTRDHADELSGRGIGLDIVRTIIDTLKGEIKVQSLPRIGTTVQLSVPMSLASTNALLVTAGGSSLAVPLDCVRQTVGMRESVFLGGKFIFQNEALPYVPLHRAVKRELDAAEPRGQQPSIAVVMQHRDGLMAVGVDALRGIQMVLVRPVPRFIEAEPFVSGVTLDVHGIPVLVIDPTGLLKMAEEELLQDHALKSARMPPLLVIDDSLTTRMLEQSIFQTAGYEVDTASSAEEGLEMARRKSYGLFLVDIEMPGMDGFSFVQLTQQDHDLRNVPAILVTSRNSVEDRKRGVDVGARDYVIKSEFDQGYLLARVKELMTQG
jgi:two-component system chemotaxis sensor kinase CheA